jgi:hypothetical protein
VLTLVPEPAPVLETKRAPKSMPEAVIEAPPVVTVEGPELIGGHVSAGELMVIPAVGEEGR